MVFKRRDKRSWGRVILESLWPRGGWARAASYVNHRLRRLPDAPHRIARGIFAGVFISFTPLFGFHFLGAAGLAWIMRGNILASLMATFFGNPITFPFIAAFGVEFGNWILGRPGEMPALEIFTAFGQAGNELWHNLASPFSGEPAHWDRLFRFVRSVWYPYLVGGILPGIVAGGICFYISLPVIIAYQNRRKKKLRERLEKRLAAIEAKSTTPAPGADDAPGAP
ncbi:DUF2062 domain-containing protein [Szabonella alba]|uniref:DUF2062 domain-containing protein n=1 Tax=Szabonella alba TaxID=2804194 RepID=A0A8K0Y1Y3_9RHOB|nr:DUF2062 domain-containing protein [Szabonella alba]MBL4918437.1 DUF2062 domain-containing protein [Szabonella alba]